MTTPPTSHDEVADGLESSSSMNVVTSTDEFVSQLLDGDILLFDKLTSTNRLVQWADNRPVGHAAIWYDDGRVAGGLDVDDSDLLLARRHSGSIAEATLKDLPTGQTRGGVFETSLSDLLALTVPDRRGAGVFVVRTVIAMRYRGLTDADRAVVVKYARNQVSNVRFAKLQLGLLAPYAFERSFWSRSGRDERASGQDLQAKPEESLELSNLIRICRGLSQRWRRKHDPTARMFCSELVYRAYQEASIAIDIVDPLFDRRTRRRSGPTRGFPTGGSSPFDRRGDSSNHPALEPTDPEIADQLAAYDDFLAADLEMTSADGASVYGEQSPFSHNPAIRTRSLGSGVRLDFADMVTPGDYWSSPSLDAIAVLHRPPNIWRN